MPWRKAEVADWIGVLGGGLDDSTRAWLGKIAAEVDAPSWQVPADRKPCKPQRILVTPEQGSKPAQVEIH